MVKQNKTEIFSAESARHFKKYESIDWGMYMNFVKDLSFF